MNKTDLEKLNKEYADQTKLMSHEFIEIFEKWLERNPRLAIVNGVHLPLHITINLIKRSSAPISVLFPELPDMFIRFMKPFEILRDKWGKMPDKEFIEQYTKIYESQFDEWFPSEKEKENFEKWFKSQNSKRTKNSKK